MEHTVKEEVDDGGPTGWICPTHPPPHPPSPPSATRRPSRFALPGIGWAGIDWSLDDPLASCVGRPEQCLGGPVHGTTAVLQAL